MRSKEMGILFEALTNGADIQELIKIGHEEIFKNPIMITNAAFKIIAMESNKNFYDPIWEYACIHGCCSNESIDIFRRDNASDRLFHEENAFIYDWNLGENIPRILARIEFKGHIFGYIIIFAVNQPFQSCDLELTNMFSHSLRVVLNATNDHTIENSFSDELILKLLNEEYSNDQSLSQELEIANWKLYPYMICMCIERSKNKNSQYYAYYLKRTINQLSDQIKTIFFDDKLVSLYQYSLESDCQFVIDQLKQIMQKHAIKAGISQPFHNLLEMSFFYKQSLTSLTVGKAIEPASSFYRYDELFPYCLLQELPLQTAKALIIPEFYQLTHFDDEHQTNFSDTLCHYYYEGLNLKTTASKLHIHRNTMTYRISKIEEILGRNISEIAFLERYTLAVKTNLWLETLASSY